MREKHVKRTDTRRIRGQRLPAGWNRWFRYKYLLFFRTSGEAAKIAAGFSIGLAVEMFTLPTFGLAFFLIFPLIYIFRASFAGALTGFLFGKIIYIPTAFIHNWVGGWVVPPHFEDWVRMLPHWLPHWLKKVLIVNVNLIAGGIIDGVILGLLFYYPMKWLIEYFTNKRKQRRKRKIHG